MCAKKIDTAERRSVEELLCPIRHFLSIFGGKWKLPIVCMLVGEAPVRYSLIKRKLGDITNVMLAQSLKELEASGVVHREQYNEVPPRVEYTLTEEGRSVLPMLNQAAQWAAENIKQNTTRGPYCDKCHTTN
jgi:DNA-binding HxlR family transcriptional regulator